MNTFAVRKCSNHEDIYYGTLMECSNYIDTLSNPELYYLCESGFNISFETLWEGDVPKNITDNYC